MSRRAAWTLIAAAVWTLWVWGTRIANIVGDPDHSAGFKLVHVGLAAVSIAFALAVGWIGWRGRKQTTASGAGGERSSRSALRDR